MEKRPQAEYIDDGRTVADMSADWMPWNRGFRRRRREAKRERSKEEIAEAKKTFRAAVKGQYLAMLPFLGCVVAAFALMYFLLRLWLT